MTDLTSAVTRVAANTVLLTSSEEATRQAAILPILSELGWPWHNVDEVTPEYSAGNGRVDYCLRTHGRSLAFLEVKRAGTELQAHQEQLLRYAFEEGVGLAVLTDGLVWWFYLPTAVGSWEQRKFFSLDIRRVDPGRAADVLTRFLDRGAVVSGEAVERARAEFAGQERERRLAEALPVAWGQLARGPDELLVELLSEAVAGIAGHQPDPEQVARFLSTITVPGLRSSKKPLEEHGASGARPRIRSTGNHSRYVPSGYTGTTPRAVVLDGVEYPVATWRDVLVTVCDALFTSNRNFAELVLPMRGRTRSYFSRSAEGLVGPLELQSELFVEGNLSANNIVKFTRDVLNRVRGSDDGFEVIINEEAPRQRRQRRARP